MLFACKCLNLVLEAESNRITAEQAEIRRTAIIEELQSAEPEISGFLKQVLGPFEKVNIAAQQSPLLQTITFDDWSFTKCVNCSALVFGADKSESEYVINATLQTIEEEITKQRASENYSPIFKILMLQAEFTTAVFGDQKPNYVDKPRIRSLQQRLTEALQRETMAVDERIRLFSEQQYALLKLLRQRGEQELHSLVGVINCVPEHIINIQPQSTTTTAADDASAAGKAMIDTPPATPDNTPMSIGNSPPLVQSLVQAASGTGRGAKAIGLKGGASRHSRTAATAQDEADADCIFELDGMAPNRTPLSAGGTVMDDLYESSDTEETGCGGGGHEDGVGIPRQSQQQRPSQGNIAKSLPISMPTAMAPFRTTEEDFDELPEESSNVDIAASIKALARSVHGEAIFGDLPRPRRPKFTTQI